MGWKTVTKFMWEKLFYFHNRKCYTTKDTICKSGEHDEHTIVKEKYRDRSGYESV